MARWHHRLDGREFERTLGVGDGQGGLACCNSWGRKELDMTERLKWTELNWIKEIKPVNPKRNQPWIFIGGTDAKAQAPMLWATQCEEPSYCKRPWWWERWKSKGEEGGRGRCLYSITDLMDMNLSKLWEIVEDGEAWHDVVHGVPKNRTWLSDWATTTISFSYTAQWFSYTYTHFFSDYFPIQVFTEYWVEVPVLYSRSFLVIY